MASVSPLYPAGITLTEEEYRKQLYDYGEVVYIPQTRYSTLVGSLTGVYVAGPCGHERCRCGPTWVR